MRPAGWHLPSDSDWTTLTTFLGGEYVAGGKLKEAGPSHWQEPTEGATNSSGFTALPGGFRYNRGAFYNIGYLGVWWSSMESSTFTAYLRGMYYNSSDVSRLNLVMHYGFSVRCLKDN